MPSKPVFPSWGTEARETSWRRIRLRSCIVLQGLLVSCTTYAPRPIDPLAFLRELESIPGPGLALAEGTDRPSPHARVDANRAVAWALNHSPDLYALLSTLDVAEADLERAGLLFDPTLSWGAMDVLALEFTNETPGTAEFVSGTGVSWPIPRPGEIGAQEGAARAERTATQWRISEAQWNLARNVRFAYLEVLAADLRVAQNESLLQLARRTATFFEAARAAGGATAIQESLAVVERASLEQVRVRLEGDRRLARQRLLNLLGLPPTFVIELTSDLEFVTSSDGGLDALVTEALESRPDVRMLMANHQVAEERLRLEIVRQWPQLALGTSLSITLPLFTRWNGPNIDAAFARRERAARTVRAKVHAVRAEVHATWTTREIARRRLRSMEETLLPRIVESLERTDEAFRAREVTIAEILVAQRQYLQARNQHLEARLDAVRADIELNMVTGRILEPEANDE